MTLVFLLFAPLALLTFLPLWLMKKAERKRIARIFVVTIAIYLLSYALCSLNGQYQWTMSGKNRIPGSIAWRDQKEWFPAGTDWHRHPGPDGETIIWNGQFLNIYCAGLIELDRAFWHRTKALSTKD